MNAAPRAPAANMPKCPHCGSKSVYLSQAEDKPIYRLLLLARARCHNCYECFFTACWGVRRRRTRKAPIPKTLETPTGANIRDHRQKAPGSP